MHIYIILKKYKLNYPTLYTLNDLSIERCSTSLPEKRTLHKIISQLKTSYTQRQNYQNLATFFIDYETVVLPDRHFQESLLEVVYSAILIVYVYFA